jgi:hypothetical protein
MTFRQFEARAASGGATIPTATGWSLAELGEAMGKQTLFTRQSQPCGTATKRRGGDTATRSMRFTPTGRECRSVSKRSRNCTGERGGKSGTPGSTNKRPNRSSNVTPTGGRASASCRSKQERPPRRRWRNSSGAGLRRGETGWCIRWWAWGLSHWTQGRAKASARREVGGHRGESSSVSVAGSGWRRHDGMDQTWGEL